MLNLQLVSASAAPLFMISVCGMTTQSAYLRLKLMLARVRFFQDQKVKLIRTFNDGEDDEKQMLVQLLDSQIEQIVGNAKEMQKGLCFLFAATATFLLNFLFVETTSFYDWIGVLVLGTGVIGLYFFVFGIGITVPEIQKSLPPLEEELVYLDLVKSHRSAKWHGRCRQN